MTAQPRLFWSLAVLSSLVVVGLYCTTATGYINHDVFVMAEAAQSVLGGKTLYGTACWDNKPPLALLAYAVPQMVFPHSYMAIQAFLGIWLILQAGVFIFFLRHDAAIPTLLSASTLVLVPLFDKEFLWASSEHWHNLFALLVIVPTFQYLKGVRSSRGMGVLIGASVVLAMHCRQTGILLALIPLTAVGCHRSTVSAKLELIASGLAGAIIAMLGILLLCGMVGTMEGYFDATFLAPRRYSEGSWTAIFKTAYFYVATYRNSALGLLLIAAFIGAFGKAEAVGFAALAVVTALLVFAPGRDHPHYMIQTLPLLAVSLQYAMTRLADLSVPAARGVTWAVAGHLIFNGLFVTTTLPFGRAGHNMKQLAAAADCLQSEARASDTLFAVGNESAFLYFATGLPSVHPVFWDMFFGRLSTTIPYRLDDVFQRYLDEPPSLLVMRDEVYSTTSSQSTAPADSEPCQRAVELCRQLVQRNPYRQVARRSGWVILRNDSTSSASVGSVKKRST